MDVQVSINPAAIYGVVLLDPPVNGTQLSRPSYKEVVEMGVPRGSHFPLMVGYPATVKTFNSKFMKLTPAWQYYWRDLMKLAMPTITDAQVNNAFYRLTGGHKCYTNGKGSDTLACYPTETNLDKGPMMKETILTSGAIVKLLDGATRYEKHAGEWYYKFAILDGNKAPPTLPLTADISWATHWASNSRRELHWDDNGKLQGRENIVNRFPEGHIVDFDYDVPVPNMGDGDFDFIPCDRVRILEHGEPFPYPYVF